jgi:DNA polymerase-4
VFAIFHEFTPLVEGLSLDEAFLDVTASERLLGAPLKIGTDIRARIRADTGLTASVGVAPNKLLAKIASDLNKPDGMCLIDAGNLREILDPLPISRLFGIGQKSLPRVLGAGIRTFGEARLASDAQLWRAFGRHAPTLRERASGLDDRPVIPDRDEKSISAEDTFPRDLRDTRQLQVELLRLADRTASRLRAQNLTAGTVTVKIRRADFRTYTRQRALGGLTQETAVIAATAEALFGEWRREQPDSAVRLLGVGVSQLDSPRQSDLFAADGAAPAGRLDSTVDDIRQRFGKAVLTRASLLPRPPHGS